MPEFYPGKTRLSSYYMGNCGSTAAILPQYLSDLSEKDKPWEVHRIEADLVEQLYRDAGFMDYGDRVHDCSQWLKFALQQHDTDELKLKLSNARFCRVRFCPVCQWRRSMKWRARFLKALPEITQAHPTHRWVFLTLTVRNCPIGELRSTLRQMGDAWKRLVQKKIFPAVGFVRATEVTRSELGEAHPHFHALLLVESTYFGRQYLKQDKWVELWQDCLRVNYAPSVRVKAIKSDADRAILECLKYGVKVQDLIIDSEWLAQLTEQVRKTRAVSVGGVLRDFIKEEEPENLVNIEEENEDSDEHINELYFDWSRIKSRYIQR